MKLDTKAIVAAAALAAAIIVVSGMTSTRGSLIQGAAITAVIYFGTPLASQLAGKVSTAA